MTLVEDVQEIGTVRVSGSIPLFTIKQDTIIFNAAAVKTQEGDETVEILRQMPGVLLSGEQISVMGKKIERTYIDDRVLFGRDPMTALNNLMAADVIKIRVYDESADQRIPGSDPNKTIRVLNIETKSKLIAATTGHLLVSYGCDLPEKGGERRDRYGIGATANFFSEKLLLSANAFTNNLNRKSNRLKDLLERDRGASSYNRNTYADVGLERNWNHNERSELSLSASYSYDNDYSKSESSSQRVYFPSPDEGYESRIVSDTTRNIATRKSHEAQASFSWIHPEAGAFLLSHDYSFTRQNADNYGVYENRTDGTNRSGTKSADHSRGNTHSLSEHVDWQKTFGEWFNVLLSGDLILRNSDGGGIKYDSLLSTQTVSVLSSSPVGESKDMKIKAMLTYNLGSMARYVRFSYDYSYQNRLIKQLAMC